MTKKTIAGYTSNIKGEGRQGINYHPTKLAKYWNLFCKK
jgi:hypothetical protein